jgi:hypothetical protein
MQSYNIIITKTKWSQLMKNEDLRFFKYVSKKMPSNQVIVKLDTWNNSNLKHAFQLCKKLKHDNLVKYSCYFEYEEDIINYLMDIDVKFDVNEENAVLIMPALSKVVEVDKCDKSIAKQIILFLYEALFNMHIDFDIININDLYYEYKSQKINYRIDNQWFDVNTMHVVKFDVYHDMYYLDVLYAVHYRNLYTNIIKLLEQMHVDMFTDVIEFLDAFCHVKSIDHTVYPLKILHTLLSMIDMAR